MFISYSHRDKEWNDQLVPHVKMLQYDIPIQLWDDRQIGAGEDWNQKIHEAMTKCRIAVLLISADYLSSDFVVCHEIPRLLERHEQDGMRLFPIIIRPCAWQHIRWLARLQVRPKDGVPLSHKAMHRPCAPSHLRRDVPETRHVHCHGEGAFGA